MKKLIIETGYVNPMFSGIMMFVFGLLSFIFGLGLFLFKGQPVYLIENLLISVCGLIYIISAIFLFRLKNWSRKIIIISSSILLLSDSVWSIRSEGNQGTQY